MPPAGRERRHDRGPHGRELGGLQRRPAAAEPASLTPEERAQRRLAACQRMLNLGARLNDGRRAGHGTSKRTPATNPVSTSTRPVSHRAAAAARRGRSFDRAFGSISGRRAHDSETAISADANCDRNKCIRQPIFTFRSCSRSVVRPKRLRCGPPPFVGHPDWRPTARLVEIIETCIKISMSDPTYKRRQVWPRASPPRQKSGSR
jgi:hypothetical protein